MGGVWLGTGLAIDRAGDYLETRSAAAAPLIQRTAIEPLPRAELAVVPSRQSTPDSIYGVDADLLAPVGAAKVTKMKLNHGGTSLSIRLDFANGSRAAFKPEQTHPQSDPRRELAAYRMDRLLGIGRVQPAKEVEIPVADLVAAIEPGYRDYIVGRLTEEGIAHGGVYRGVASWWIPEIKLATIGGLRLDEQPGRELWIAQLQIGAPMTAEYRPMLAQLSACILFDLLIDNSDRWSGGNTMMSPDGTQLYFMDNSLSFSKATYGHEQTVLAMRRIQIYPRGLVDKLRKLTREQIEATLAVAPDSQLGPLIKPIEVTAMLARRDNMLKWIDQLIARYGEDVVLAFE